MVQLINGYACHNCADTALAKRGINPAKPDGAAGGAPAVTASAGASAKQQPGGAQAVSGAGEPGRLSPPPAGRGRLIDLVA